MPAVQETFGALPPSQYVPASHASQTAGSRAVAGATSTVPGWQSCAEKQEAWFGAFENVPAAHAAHVRSETEEPALLTYEPGSQGVHAMHDATLSATLNVPLTQLAHVRSVTVVPALPTLCPGTHALHATHALPGLESSSHVPSGHGMAGAFPPAQ